MPSHLLPELMMAKLPGGVHGADDVIDIRHPGSTLLPDGAKRERPPGEAAQPRLQFTPRLHPSSPIASHLPPLPHWEVGTQEGSVSEVVGSVE
jgi:hypothetical protein